MGGGNLQLFEIYLIYQISSQYYLLLSLSFVSYPAGVRVGMLCLYPHSSNISGATCHPRLHNLKEPEVLLEFN